MWSIIAVTNKHIAKLRHVGSLYILSCISYWNIMVFLSSAPINEPYRICQKFVLLTAI